jgi:hypothetical protein
MYSQLPSITGGRSSIRNLRTRHAVVTGTHLTWPSAIQGVMKGIKVTNIEKKVHKEVRERIGSRRMSFAKQVNLRFVPVHAVKAYRRSRAVDLLFFNLYTKCK